MCWGLFLLVACRPPTVWLHGMGGQWLFCSLLNPVWYFSVRSTLLGNVGGSPACVPNRCYVIFQFSIKTCTTQSLAGVGLVRHDADTLFKLNVLTNSGSSGIMMVTGKDHTQNVTRSNFSQWEKKYHRHKDWTIFRLTGLLLAKTKNY